MGLTRREWVYRGREGEGERERERERMLSLRANVESECYKLSSQSAFLGLIDLLRIKEIARYVLSAESLGGNVGVALLISSQVFLLYRRGPPAARALALPHMYYIPREHACEDNAPSRRSKQRSRARTAGLKVTAKDITFPPKKQNTQRSLWL